jgi:hypothetical protein
MKGLWEWSIALSRGSMEEGLREGPYTRKPER